MNAPSKQQKDENFPVSSILLAKSYRQIVTDYYNFARYCDDIADNPQLSSSDKLKTLDKIENIFLEPAKYSGKRLAFAKTLSHDFRTENLSSSLVLDLLKAFRWDSEGFEYKTWGQLMNYCQYSAAPVGRFLLALHNENPSTYLPSNALCAVLQITNHLQDIKNDAILLKRVYIPQELMQKYQVSIKDLQAAKSSENLKNLIQDIILRLRGLLKDAELLPSIMQSFRLKTEVCIIIYLTNIVLNKLNSLDVLGTPIKLTRYDWAKAIVFGTVQSLFTRYQSLTVKGI